MNPLHYDAVPTIIIMLIYTSAVDLPNPHHDG